jgi:hypothetical protein
MSRGWLTVVVCLPGLALAAGPAAADDAKPAKKTDPTAALLQKLREPAVADAAEVPLTDFVDVIYKRHSLGVILNDASFRACGMGPPGNMIVKSPDVRGALSVGRQLQMALAPHGATYLVRNGYVEVVPIAFAAKVTKNAVPGDDEGGLAEPLVSVVYKEKPLNEAVADLAEEFELNVVVAPQAGDNRMAFVSARLLNVPADKALELIAIQAELRVVRKGTAFLITSRDHANDMFGERLEKEKQKIEVERLRRGLELPEPPPQPVPPPGPVPPAPPPTEKKN